MALKQKQRINHFPGTLADSGQRTVTETGALRDPQGADPANGRWDLIPPECVEAVMRVDSCRKDEALHSLFNWLADADTSVYGGARFCRYLLEESGSVTGGLFRLAKHYARGAQKYSDRNWEKGLETGRTVQSLFNHFRKLEAGDTDEDHRMGAVWNCFALMFTLQRIQSGKLPKTLDTYGLVK